MRTRKIIWTSREFYDEKARRDWWRERYECSEIAQVDICAKLGININNLSEYQIECLDVIANEYVHAHENNIPPIDMEMWEQQVQEYFELEQENLGVDINGVIVAFKDVGLWNGRRRTARIVGNCIADILIHHEEEAEFFAENEEIKATLTHHDGNNFVLFRIVENQDRAKEIAYLWTQCNTSEADIKRRTTSLYPYVADIYGWTQEAGQEQDKEKAVLI